MSFLNPEEKTRIKIRKIADQPVPKPAAPGAPGAAPAKGGPAPAGAKPGLRPGAVPAKPGAPGAPGAARPAGAPPLSVAAVVKPKLVPKVDVMQVEPGIFEVHFTCSCGEQYVIRCDSAEKSSATPPSQ